MNKNSVWAEKTDLTDLLREFADFLKIQTEWEYDDRNFTTKLNSLSRLIDFPLSYLPMGTLISDKPVVAIAQKVIENEGLYFTDKADDPILYGAQNLHQTLGAYVFHRQGIYINCFESDQEQYVYIHELVHHFDLSNRLFERVKFLTEYAMKIVTDEQISRTNVEDEMTAILGAYMVAAHYGIHNVAATGMALRRVLKNEVQVRPQEIAERVRLAYTRTLNAFRKAEKQIA